MLLRLLEVEMKKLLSLMSLFGVFLLVSGFTQPHQNLIQGSSAKSLKGRIGVGKALGYSCQVKIVSSSQKGLYSPIFMVEFAYVNKFVSKNNKTIEKLYPVKEYFNLEQYGENDAFFGRKLNQQLAANQQPTTLQVFKDPRTLKYKAIYYNGSHLVCDQMTTF